MKYAIAVSFLCLTTAAVAQQRPQSPEDPDLLAARSMVEDCQQQQMSVRSTAYRLAAENKRLLDENKKLTEQLAEVTKKAEPAPAPKP